MLGLLYYALPLYVANAAPPLLAKVPGLRRLRAPIDFGLRWRGKPLLGANKTWRGLVGGSLAAMLVFLLQRGMSVPFSAAPYAELPWWTGGVLGLGALVGDVVESFVKRRVGIKSGKPWVPFDQTDYILGAFALTWWLYWPGWGEFALLLVLSGMLSLLAHMAGYALGVNKDPV